MKKFNKDTQYFKFCFYGFLKNLRFFDAFFILFLMEKGLPFTQIGILYAVREVFINVFEIPSGILADTYGRKNALMASFVAYILSFIIFNYATGFNLFMFAFILFGMADAFRSGTNKGMIMDYLKLHNWQDQKIEYYGHTRSWSQIGSAISALIAGFIVFISGSFQNIFIYSIIPYLINLVLVFTYPNEINHSIDDSASKKRIGLTVQSFFKVMKQPNVLRVINSSAVHSAYLKAVKDYIQPLMVNVALITPILLDTEVQKKNGLVIGVLYFLIYLTTSRASKFSSILYNKNKLNISSYTLMAGFIFGLVSGFFYVYDLWVVSLLAFIGIYIVENVRKPILTGIVSDNVPNKILTSVLSAQSLLKTLMTAVLALSFGILVDLFGIGVSFIVVSLFLFLSMLLLNRLK